ncbi:hypothetical protein IFR05_013691 [Cadophora sp. M221]|nr:hypothetical protein IFR05_013691 [Cadophora sp. M221]
MGPAVRGPTLCQLVPDDFWNEGVTFAVLNTRAWVAQERMLSPRTIHFGKKQIFWECRELNACELFPNGPPTRLLRNQHHNFDVGYKHLAVDLASDELLQNKMAAVALTPNSQGHSDQIIKEGLAIWGRVIEVYTTCKLTQDTDKLVAISAVAKKISPLCRSSYLAGLWRRSLPYQLLWTTRNHDSPQAPFRPRSYCAPTWSWASTTIPCKSFAPVDTRRENFMIKILQADVKTKGDEMGTVLGGHLKLRCWLESVPSHSSGGITEYSDFDAELLTFTDSRGQSVTIAINVDDNTLPRTDNWYLMPVVDEPEIASSKRIFGPENRMIHGLILLQTEERDVFCRAGTFSAEKPHTEHFMVPKYVDGVGSKDTEEYERVDRAARFRDLEIRRDSYFSLEYRILEGIVQDADIQRGWVERVIRIV